jgi:hypothetical protein
MALAGTRLRALRKSWRARFRSTGRRCWTAACRLRGAAEHESDWLGHDPRGAFRTAAAVHLTGVVVHGLDIAIAIGHQDLVGDELCAGLLAHTGWIVGD